MLHRFKLFYVILHCFTSFHIILHHFTSVYIILHHFTSFYIILHHFTLFYIILHHFKWKELSFLFLLTKVEKANIAVQSVSVVLYIWRLIWPLYFVNQTKENYKAELCDLVSFYIKTKTNHYLRLLFHALTIVHLQLKHLKLIKQIFQFLRLSKKMYFCKIFRKRSCCGPWRRRWSTWWRSRWCWSRFTRTPEVWRHSAPSSTPAFHSDSREGPSASSKQGKTTFHQL